MSNGINRRAFLGAGAVTTAACAAAPAVRRQGDGRAVVIASANGFVRRL